MTKAQVNRKNKQVPELMGRFEVAQLLGTKTNNVNVIVGLPAPIPQQLRRGDLWRGDVMREFAAEREQRKAQRRGDG